MTSGVLSTLRTKLGSWLTASVIMFTVGLAGAAGLALLLLDAAIDLPDEIRAAAPWLVGCCALLVVVGGFLRWRRFREERVARLFEISQPALGSQLSNAVELSREKGATPVEEVLRRDAVELGRKAASTLAAWPLMRRAVGLASLTVVVAAVAWTSFAFLGQDIFRAVWPRFTEPYGDHPPYSRLTLELVPGGAEVLYGGQLEVKASASGKPVNKLWLVTKTGTNTSRAIMFLAPDKRYFQTLANLREPAEYFVTDGAARSRRFPIKIRNTPQITLVEVATDFPEYTGKKARTAKLADEPQTVPADTRVTLRVASNRPLKSGELTLTPVLGGAPKKLSLTPEGGGNMVRNSFTLTEAVTFSVSVQDVDGLNCVETKGGRFNISPDERPRLFVLEPGRDAVATPNFSIPIKVQATDDYGVSRVVWLRGHNRSIERPFSMKVALKNGPQSVEASGAFELEKLGVRPGDLIEYYFEAADNYPKGPNVALSRIYKLQVISKEQYEQILRSAAARKALFEPYLKLDAWLQRMAERSRKMEKTAQAGTPQEKEALGKEAKELSDDLEKYHEELGKLLQRATMFDVEKSFRDSMVEQHTGLADVKKNLKSALGNGVPNPKQMRQLSDALNNLAKKNEEEVAQPAKQIVSVIQLLARADEFVKLAQAQATLAQMLQRFADNTNALSRIEQIEVQELTQQQTRIDQALRKLMENLPEQVAKLPAESEFDSLRKDVEGFIAAVNEAKIQEDLHNAAKVLGEPDTMTGYSLAKTAAEKMDKLVGKCQGMPKEGQQCLTARFKPKMSSGMGSTVEQILAAMNAGSGQGGRDGYGLFNEDVALYGPNVELAGEQAGGRRDDSTGSGQGRRNERVTGDSREPDLATTGTPGRVRLQPDAKFPLRYRDLVGEYFKSIAETEGDEKP